MPSRPSGQRRDYSCNSNHCAVKLLQRRDPLADLATRLVLECKMRSHCTPPPPTKSGTTLSTKYRGSRGTSRPNPRAANSLRGIMRQTLQEYAIIGTDVHRMPCNYIISWCSIELFRQIIICPVKAMHESNGFGADWTEPPSPLPPVCNKHTWWQGPNA